jgi:hypothetical protein
LQEDRSVHRRCRRRRRLQRRCRYSMGRLTHHSHQRRPCRLPPRTRRCCWDNRRPRLRKCRRYRRGCSNHRCCTGCPGSKNYQRHRKPRKWQFLRSRCTRNWRQCRCGLRRSHSRVGQCHRKRCKWTWPSFRCRPCQRRCSSDSRQSRSKARQNDHKRRSYRMHRQRRTQHFRPCTGCHSTDHPGHRRFPHPRRKRPVRIRRLQGHWSRRRQTRYTDWSRPQVRSSLRCRKSNPGSKPDQARHRYWVARPRSRRSVHRWPGRRWRHDSLEHRSNQRLHP